MAKTPITFYVALVATVALTVVPGCSKKAVQSAGDQTSQQKIAEAGSSGNSGNSGTFGTSDGTSSGVGSFPDTTMQSSSSVSYAECSSAPNASA